AAFLSFHSFPTRRSSDLVGLTALVFMLVRLNPDFRFVLDLDPARVLHGEVWRLVTYIFLPQTAGFLWIILFLWFLWFIGDGLERSEEHTSELQSPDHLVC